MNFLSLKHRKIIATITLVALIVPFGVGIKPQKAEAALPVWNFANAINDFKEWVVDGTLGWAFVNILIAQMGNNIINWINSGFEGDPLFISNPEEFFLGVINDTTGKFIRDYQLSAVCDLYKPQILIALAQTQNFDTSSECTLLDAVDNIDAFLDDFSQGGWEGWIQLTQQPQNNIYGSYLIAVDEKSRRLAEALGNKKDEVNQNQGFISLKRCAIYDTTYEFDPENYEFNLQDTDIPYVSTDGIEGCLQTETVTPGQAIVGQLNDSLGAPLARLGEAEEITEAVLSGIMNALINQLVLGGLRSLSGGGGDGGTNLYTDAFSQDKDALLAIIDETIAENNKIGGADGAIKVLLRTYAELHTCYADQKETISLVRYNPPNDFVTPSVPNITARQIEIVESVAEFESLISGVSSEGTVTQLRKFTELKERIIEADEAGEINPSTLAEFWTEYNQIRREIDLQDRATDLGTVKRVEGELGAIKRELEICETTLEKLEGYVGGSKTIPVNVQNWPDGFGPPAQ